MTRIRRALVSVTDKSGLVDFVSGLAALGIEVLSTGGTAQALRNGGIAVVDVSDYTGFPEIMDGRVKTLHPKVHGGILARRDVPAHVEAMEQHQIRPIDMVVVNLYRFEETVARPGIAVEEAIENIDIGGPSMIRSAAKNFAHVGVVTSPGQYDAVLAELRQADGSLSTETRRSLARAAFAATARYDGAITAYLQGLEPRGSFPETIVFSFAKERGLRYGENPHQAAAFYRTPKSPGACAAWAEVLGGKELSYNNLLDADSAFELVREFTRPTAVVVKHNNPCGAGSADGLLDAYRKALAGDPVSAFGGILALNRPIDLATAEAIAVPECFFEVLIAPEFEPGTVELLTTRTKWGKNLRVLRAGGIGPREDRGLDVRGLTGGALVQTPNRMVFHADGWKLACGSLTPAQERDLRFAWTVCKHVKSNAIVLARDEAVVGVGAGQMSRVDSAWIAVRKAGDRAKGSVVASDAFFPFPDALEVVLDAGATAAVQPGGSIRDKEVLAVAEKRGAAMVLTGIRHFRH